MKFELTRIFPVDPPQLFACFTDPELLAQWWSPFGAKCLSADLDARAGGSFRIEYSREGSEISAVFGTYILVEPPRRLSFTWRRPSYSPGEETTVTLDFEEISDGTRLHLTHEGFVDAQHLGGQGGGWESLMEALQILVDNPK